MSQKRLQFIKSYLIYSTRFPDDSPINRSTIKKYQLHYNYETMNSLNDAINRNSNTQLCNDALIEKRLFNILQPKEIPLLRSSEKSNPLFTRDDEPTVGNFDQSKEFEYVQRKQRYIDYFKRHYGTL
jgi:hypothetical protein